MKKNKFSNTYQRGRYTLLVVKEKNKFIGVCLEFDLMVSCPTLQTAKTSIDDYAEAWWKNVVKNKLPESLLNKKAPKKYWDIAKSIEEEKEAKKHSINPVFSSHQIYSPQYIAFA